jgi:predicted NBD/HSP70 family sugar kinase
VQLLAIDVGGSGIKYALSDESLTLHEKGLVPTSFDTHAGFVEAVGGVFERFDGIDAVAMSCCGELDPRSGYMFSGGAHVFNAGTNMIESIGARCGVPVSIENDANCALLAEVHSGSLTDCENAVVLVMGTGIGGAVLINRRVYRGSHFHSGNASQVRVDLSRPGSRPLARVAGVRGAGRTYAARAGIAPGEVDLPTMFAQCDAGDPVALGVLDEWCSQLAVFIHNTQLMLDVEAFAIGGGVSAQPRFLSTLRDHVFWVFGNALVEVPQPEVRACRYRNDANLIGAVFHHFNPDV